MAEETEIATPEETNRAVVGHHAAVAMAIAGTGGHPPTCHRPPPTATNSVAPAAVVPPATQPGETTPGSLVQRVAIMTPLLGHYPQSSCTGGSASGVFIHQYLPKFFLSCVQIDDGVGLKRRFL